MMSLHRACSGIPFANANPDIMIVPAASASGLFMACFCLKYSVGSCDAPRSDGARREREREDGSSFEKGGDRLKQGGRREEGGEGGE